MILTGLRYRDSHPVLEKFRALEKYMKDNNISIELDADAIIFNDNDTNDGGLIMEVETNLPSAIIPSKYEIKIVYKLEY